MTPGEFEDVIAGRAERDEWTRAQFASVAAPVYQLGGASVTVDTLLGRARDFDVDMVPSLERTPEEQRDLAMRAARERAERERASREEARARRALDPLEFDETRGRR